MKGLPARCLEFSFQTGVLSEESLVCFLELLLPSDKHQSINTDCEQKTPNAKFLAQIPCFRCLTSVNKRSLFSRHRRVFSRFFALRRSSSCFLRKCPTSEVALSEAEDDPEDEDTDVADDEVCASPPAKSKLVAPEEGSTGGRASEAMPSTWPPPPPSSSFVGNGSASSCPEDLFWRFIEKW